MATETEKDSKGTDNAEAGDCRRDWRDYKYKRHHHGHRGHGGDAVYTFGFLGALVYYIHIATSFWAGFLGFLKAIIWPAFLIFKIFTMLKL